MSHGLARWVGGDVSACVGHFCWFLVPFCFPRIASRFGFSECWHQDGTGFSWGRAMLLFLLRLVLVLCLAGLSAQPPVNPAGGLPDMLHVG